MTGSARPPELSWGALLIGVGLMLGLSVDPGALIRRNGEPNHTALMLAVWAMSAGLVRGVGFIPRAWYWRVLLSGRACALAVLLGVLAVAVDLRA